VDAHAGEIEGGSRLEEHEAGVERRLHVRVGDHRGVAVEQLVYSTQLVRTASVNSEMKRE
jgi:hypothetical protein